MGTYIIRDWFHLLFDTEKIADEGFVNVTGRLRNAKPAQRPSTGGFPVGWLGDPDVAEERFVGRLPPQEITE